MSYTAKKTKRRGIIYRDDMRIWGTRDVAAWLQTTEDRVCLLARTGEIPARKVGRLWRFRVSALLDWFIEGGRAQKKGCLSLKKRD